MTDTPNLAPTVIVLDTPYSTGDLTPDVTYPHVYITTLYVNGPALTMNVTYEYGTMSPGGWQQAPFVPTSTVQFAGPELFPFFGRLPGTVETSLWDQVEQGLYEQIQERDARAAGKVLSFAPPAANTSSSST